jgi:hypothetical protein
MPEITAGTVSIVAKLAGDPEVGGVVAVLAESADVTLK